MRTPHFLPHKHNFLLKKRSPKFTPTLIPEGQVVLSPQKYLVSIWVGRVGGLAGERKILRKIFGPTEGDNGNWRIKTNLELDEVIKHRNIINYVKARRLSWFGHINRRPETGIVKKIHKWKPFTGRPVGRPKFRWEDDVRNDLKKMKLIKWTEQVQDRLKWKGTVEKVKTLPEL